MWCSVKANKNNTLYGIVEDLSRVKVLAIIKKGYKNDSNYYIIEAKWDGCTNPNRRDTKLKVFVDPSIQDDRSGELFGAYWVDDFCIEKTWEDYSNNKEASKMLSSDY